MNPKERQNHEEYIRVLREMTPEQRLLKAFELSDFTKQLFIHGLRKRFPELSEAILKNCFWRDLINVTIGITKN